MAAIFIKLCQGQNLSFPPTPFNLTCINKNGSSNDSIQCNTVTSVSAGPDLTQNRKGLFREEGNRELSWLLSKLNPPESHSDNYLFLSYITELAIQPFHLATLLSSTFFYILQLLRYVYIKAYQLCRKYFLTQCDFELGCFETRTEFWIISIACL